MQRLCSPADVTPNRRRNRHHYRHQRIGAPPSAYPTALLRVVLSCREAVTEAVLLPKSLQMFAEGNLSEAVDRHGMAVPDDAAADLLPELRRDAAARLGLWSAWRGRRACGEGKLPPWPSPAAL